MSTSNWTCEACRCHTNQATDASCTICGTARAGANLLRRVGFPSRFRDWEDDEEEEELWAEPALANLSVRDLQAQPYAPVWENPATLAPRVRAGNGIEVDGAMAHVPLGAGEGRALRGMPPLPSSRPVGFRVAFHHPLCEPGGNMGGSYLVGVASASFTSFGDPNGLQESPFFWGIEDSGTKHEGSRSLGRMAGSMDLDESTLSASGVLFGSRDVISVVMDATYSLTFWRNDTCLGTLCRNLPRTGELYPVAVPFNGGVAVAITSLTEDPLPQLQSFAADWHRERLEQDEVKRQQLLTQRGVLIDNGQPTAELISVLQTIFALYKTSDDKPIVLPRTAAARLWYRCGMKLASLDKMDKSAIAFADFLDPIIQVIEEDERELQARIRDGSFTTTVQVGDKVELVENVIRVSDSSGPLQAGERCRAVAVQFLRGGEVRSVRVACEGRRWWYKPHAVLPERSGLIESPAVWFLRKILRSHGYDHKTLACLWGEPVTSSSWCVGDFVIPKDIENQADSDKAFGRIVADAVNDGSFSLGSQSRESGQVAVSFTSRAFGDAVGLTPSEDGTKAIETRRVHTTKLLYCSPFHYSIVGGENEKPKAMDLDEDDDTRPVSNLSEKVAEDIAKLVHLDKAAIENVTKECSRSTESLAAMFSNGLPGSVLAAVDQAYRALDTPEPKDDLPDRVDALCGLVKSVAEELFVDASPPAVPPPPVRTTRSRAAQESRRQARPRRESSSAPSNNNESALASLRQQRRSVLMNLVARARRGQGTSFLNQFLEVSGGGLQAERALGQLAPSLGSVDFRSMFGDALMGGIANDPDWDLLRSGSPSELLENAPDGDEDQSDVDEEESDHDESRSPVSLLDTMIRSFDGSVTSDKKQRLAQLEVLGFAKKLTTYGLLVDNKTWINALIDAQVEDNSSKPSASLLKKTQDESKDSILYLAVSFGCSPEVISLLMSYGAHVGAREVTRAAETSQARTLGILLRRNACPADMPIDSFTVDVKQVIQDARERQDKLEKEMREEGREFVVELMRKLMKLALLTRRRQEPRMEQCSRSLCTALFGDVLLCTLQETQKQDRILGDSEMSDRTGRFTLDSAPQRGLLSTMPSALVSEAVASSHGDQATCFQLLEDLMYTKDNSDVASGLSTLASLLTHCQGLSSNEEMKRYGLFDLVRYHEKLASERIAKLSSTLKRSTKAGSMVAVRCPKGHVACLHVTRHSSFRCDMCGCSVERGKPMHGCHCCDWDACEACTDKSESGILKQQKIQSVALACLEHDPAGDSNIPERASARKSEEGNSPSSIDVLADRLARRDMDAPRQLAQMLHSPDAPTAHQFLTILLPALHNACTAIRHEGNAHKSKKAKVGGDRFGDSIEFSITGSDGRFAFVKEVVSRMLVLPMDDPREEDSEKGYAKVPDNESSPLRLGRSPQRGPAIVDPSSELMRRLHQVLSLHETAVVSPCLEAAKKASGSELQSLTKTVELHLVPTIDDEIPASFGNDKKLVVHAEPLLPVCDLASQLLRSFAFLEPTYLDFYRRLAVDRAVILERAVHSTDNAWRLARVTGFDETIGSLRLQYAKALDGFSPSDVLTVSTGKDSFLSAATFKDEQESHVLVMRDVVILRRFRSSDRRMDHASTPSDLLRRFDSDAPIGRRVECKIADSWKVFTLMSIRELPTEDEDASNKESHYTVVADDGTVYDGIPQDCIRLPTSGILGQQEPLWNRRRRGESTRAYPRSAFPFLSAGQRLGDLGVENSHTLDGSLHEVGALKRSWSALSLAENMRPVELEKPKEANEGRSTPDPLSWGVLVGDVVYRLSAGPSSVEWPPRLGVRLSLAEKMPGLDVDSLEDETLVGALMKISDHQKLESVPLRNPCRVLFSLGITDQGASAKPGLPCLVELSAAASMPTRKTTSGELTNRARKVSARSPSVDMETRSMTFCDGMDDTCVRCLETMSVLLEQVEQMTGSNGTEDRKSMACFANSTLSKKLSSQLEDPLSVVGGAMPEWCILAPSVSPRVFAYEVRRSLLERAAFGVSRSTFKQQEAKINVGRYRQRMASLRARAVELVGEAFSGGAEDPTALQLQADELYGMEETLANRVRSTFRAMKWKEHSLEVVKAAVRRDQLLTDAAHVMERYAMDDSVCRRRLEVRFDGESGFDAASGDEAGVTRGFYADVAEALLSCDNVAGVYCSTSCSLVGESASLVPTKTDPMDIDIEGLHKEASKLPLWIPDMDSTAQVVIPTPRADPQSGLGVYPRPLPTYHPQMVEVLHQFRTIGRLFAAAMRDDFMFPLPLSASFLKLVQHCGGSPTLAKRDGPTSELLGSLDLPRPGFLGGEIYAAEAYICRELDDLDTLDPPLDRQQLMSRYLSIANDKNFARIAFGKAYDCSFADYFADRTFVDPLDPMQGEDAVPLCPKGHAKSVTIYNVREWVALAKAFCLHDGVLAQAQAFRQGVDDFFSADHLRLFTPNELQRDVCGAGDNVDRWDDAAVRKLFKLDGGKGTAEALVAVAAIGGEGGAALSRRFGPTSPTINYLVKALLEATTKERRQFLSFVTSVPIATPGKIEVVPMVSPGGEFLPLQDPSVLPRANTCARRLYLPKFESYESFHKVLWAVVREESRFKGFYEWRGN